MGFRPSGYMLKVREVHPLVHHITNYVTVNDCANVCICAGGSPIMSDSAYEVEEMVASADALVLNIGTINERTLESMKRAGKAAGKVGKPIILDPVGVGATKYRTNVVEGLISSLHPSIIKSNMGEMSTIVGCKGMVRGVDSVSSCKDLADRMLAFAKENRCVLVSTGPTDYVTDGRTFFELSNGVPMLENVSGTGCSVTTMIGVYAGACGPSAESAVAAVSAFNIAAEDAIGHCAGPGTFKPALLDSLYAMKPETIDEKVRFKAF